MESIKKLPRQNEPETEKINDTHQRGLDFHLSSPVRRRTENEGRLRKANQARGNQINRRVNSTMLALPVRLPACLPAYLPTCPPAMRVE